MKSMNRKWWLGLVALLCLAPASFAIQDAGKPKKCDPRRPRNCHQVPEGGTSLVYVLGAGVTCLGAILVRSRGAKPNES
jgi:hypothetical protein